MLLFSVSVKLKMQKNFIENMKIEKKIDTGKINDNLKQNIGDKNNGRN